MVDRFYSALEGLWLKIRSYLESQSVVQAGADGWSTVAVSVRNAAPEGPHLPIIVFVGVGLSLEDMRTGQRPNWGSSLKRTQPTERLGIAHVETQGHWFGGPEELPKVTQPEQRTGDVLLPGQSVSSELNVPTAELAYAHIAVEGTLSRRHLYHIVQPLEELGAYSRPLIIETIQLFNALDIHAALRATVSPLSTVGPRTTINAIQGLKQTLSAAGAELEEIIKGQRELFNAAPTSRLKTHFNQVVGLYLQSTRRLLASAVEALDSGDLRQMEALGGGLEEQQVEAGRVNRLTEELMTSYGINPVDVGYRYAG